jgi:DNA polymerase zeta
MNPHPIKLQMEKVYHPCILVSKKRYAGLKFESKEDLSEYGGNGGLYDAKGIETVRRDTCPANSKILYKTLMYPNGI